MRYYFTFFIIIFSVFSFVAKADTIRTVLNQETIEKGYTLQSQNSNFKIGIQPEAIEVNGNVKLAVKKLDKSNYNLENKNIVSAIYSFDLYSADNININNNKPLWLNIKYKKSKGKKIIKFFDQSTGKWKNLPTANKKKNRIATATTYLTYAEIAVFNKKSKKTTKNNKKTNENIDYQEGVASWYVHDGAASTKYPYGSIVKVTNIANNNSVEVTINDYGPFIAGRIIDLPKSAFAQIADLGAGVINVRVEPIYIP